jgi:hypothetical protein
MEVGFGEAANHRLNDWHGRIPRRAGGLRWLGAEIQIDPLPKSEILSAFRFVSKISIRPVAFGTFSQRRRTFPHRIGQFAIEARDRLTIFGTPVGEKLPEQSPARRRDCLDRAPSIGREDRLADALITRVLLAGNQSQAFELGRLATDRRMIAPHLFGEFDDTKRTRRTDPHEQWKQGAVERYAGFPQQNIVLPRTVQKTHKVEQGTGQFIIIMCIVHALQSLESSLYARV